MSEKTMSGKMEEKNVIYVRTLGSYSVNYNGAEIAIGSRDESQIGLLMLLMFFGRMGGLTMIYAAVPSGAGETARMPQENINVG